MGECDQSDAIQIRVEQVSQLFSTLDPFPFHERDLDRDAEEYIVGWARELPKDRSIRIIVHLPETEAATTDAQGIGDAFSHFFEYRANVAERDLKELFRIGRQSLCIGLAALGTCLFLAQAVAGRLGPGQIGRFIQEGLIIVGWVANWRPIEIFLYDWLPLAARRNLYRRLGSAEVMVSADIQDRRARTRLASCLNDRKSGI